MICNNSDLLLQTTLPSCQKTGRRWRRQERTGRSTYSFGHCTVKYASYSSFIRPTVYWTIYQCNWYEYISTNWCLYILLHILHNVTTYPMLCDNLPHTRGKLSLVSNWLQKVMQFKISQIFTRWLVSSLDERCIHYVSIMHNKLLSRLTSDVEMSKFCDN